MLQWARALHSARNRGREIAGTPHRSRDTIAKFGVGPRRGGPGRRLRRPYAHADSYPHAYAGSHADADSYPYPYAHAYPHADVDSYPYPYAHAHSYADAHLHPHA